MSWVMTSKRYRGVVGSPPRVEFMIGNVYIATVTMLQPGGRWAYDLEVNSPYAHHAAIPTISHHESFSAALTELHKQLNAPPPEGFEIFSKKQHEQESANGRHG